MSRLLTLKEACTHLAGDKITPATLRAEAARGKLDIVRLGRRDFVTVEALEQMVSACHVEQKAPVSISIPRASNGLSETDRVSSAQAALNQTIARLKSGSRNTLDRNTNRSAARRR